MDVTKSTTFNFSISNEYDFTVEGCVNKPSNHELSVARRSKIAGSFAKVRMFADSQVEISHMVLGQIPNPISQEL